MNRLKQKILNYLRYNKDILIINDSEKEIKTENILDLALEIKDKNLVNKKIVINFNRSAEYISIIFALWLNGNTVIPTNKNWPKNYVDEIFRTCGAEIIFNESFYEKLKLVKKVLSKKNFDEKIKSLENSNLNNTIPYIIFTSGTTSKQKGVIISEDSYLEYISWTSKEFSEFSNLKSLILTSELNFDITFGDIAFALFSSCKIVIPNNNTNIFEIIQLIDKYKIEVMYTVPNLFKLLFLVLKEYPISETIKLFISGGEALNKQICVDAKNLFPKSSFYNVYGPTECTINITSYKVNLEEIKNKKVVPIGKVFPHLYWKVIPTEIDKSIGELMVGGGQLMQGYINKEYDFLINDEKKYYNTGDLVRIENDLIYWLARNDSMIKKKGLRIYTTEIDEVVENKNIKTISKTILINDNLILFYKGNVKVEKISQSIKENLPSYMHPTKIINVKQFPLGPTGKIDLNKLKMDYETK